MSIKVIQLQFLPNQSLNTVLNKRIRTIDASDQGNNKNQEAFS